GPDGTLTALTQSSLEDPGTSVLVPMLRKDRPEASSALGAVAALYADGARVDWTVQLPESASALLPTYAFQRRRYWLDASQQAGDPTAVGLERAEHPLLAAAVSVADTGGIVLSGRLSTRSHPWLADHCVLGRAILPATAYLELAVYAGDQVGLGQVAELTLETPLVVPDHGAVQLQLALGGPDDDGQRAFSVHSRAVEAGPDMPWTRHAQGLLAEAADPAPAPDGSAWPPPDAVPVVPGGAGEDDWYERFAVGGFGYGPAFRGLGNVWRHDQDLFAEVALPEANRAEAAGYGLHPALLDAAVQTLLVRALDGSGAEEAAATLPFAWNGFTLHATGATALRVHLAPTGRPDEYTVSVSDSEGRTVATADGLLLRRVTAGQIPDTLPSDAAVDVAPPSLLVQRWRPVVPQPVAPAPETARWALIGQGDGGLAETLDSVGVHLECYAGLVDLAAAVDTGTAAPEVVLSVLTSAPVPAPDATRALLAGSVDLVRRWVDDERFSRSRLVLVTRGALAADEGEDVTDLAGAALWGLIRSAQLEHPDRIRILDLPASAGTVTDAAVAAAVLGGGPQGAVRDGGLLVPDLTELPQDVPAPVATTSPAPFDPDRTVLLTGATGALGTLVARHLVTAHGARRLLLVSRRGGDAPGAEELAAELAAHGAEVTLAACDVADPAGLEDLLARIPDEHPLTAVVHVAGVVDDATLASLTDDKTDRVLRPKADAAWHLHRLTEKHDLSAFVLFSSAAGTFGAAGQGGYAAANAFLDALALHRRSQGLPATSIAWGLWAADSGMTAGLGAADLERMARGGMLPLTAGTGLALFDAALAAPEAAVVAVARRSPVSPARTRVRRSVAGTSVEADGGRSLARRLAGLDAAQRLPVLVETVRDQVALVLGHDSTDEVLPDRHFAELGFDSLTAVELRNRLGTVTGFRLPATLVFDLDTPQALAEDLAQRFATEQGTAAAQARAAETVPQPAAATRPQDTVGALFRAACEQGRVDEGFALLQAVAGLRPVFESPAELPGSPAGLRLAAGSNAAEGSTEHERPALICFSSYVALAGVHQYARFASAFRGERDVWALPTPGFGRGEPLPASLDVVARTQAEWVLRCAGGRPFVLTGSSSGGILALAAARHLEKAGSPPLGVALLDTYMPRLDSPFTRFSAEMLSGMFERESMFAHMDADRLSAMSWYISMIGEWDPGAPAAPVVLVRPSEPPVTAAPDGPLKPEDWQSSWDGAGTVVDVPGNHFTMMESHAATTAGALTAWIDTVPAPHAATGTAEPHKTVGRSKAHRTEEAR
ncbi:SDR family NAD(P)-dependent oxidoreductase, partial [Streptomyces graminilatus]|uniref:SDR family NAD(P)-dependent oxidoreductase n=1 Tax=Streptomyces graminilatus TaxID=1464070 RepID=UPI000B01DC96